MTKNSKLIRFRQNKIQQLLTKRKTGSDAVLKARQFGISTGEILDLFDDAIFKRNTTCGIIADRRESIQKLFEKVQFAYRMLPEGLRPKLDRGGGSKYEYYFPEINSKIFCSLEVYGTTVNRLHVSEAALMKDKTKLDSTKQALAHGGSICLETTPKGCNWFFDEWNDPDSIYTKHFFPWYLHDEYRIQGKLKEYSEEEMILKQYAKENYQIEIDDSQLIWRKYKKRELKDQFLEQYPENDQSCFLTSGNCVFNLVKLSELKGLAKQPIQSEPELEIFEEFRKGHKYIIGVDTAEGVGGDFCAAVVINCSTMEQVGLLHGQWHPFDFAHKVEELAKRYQKGGSLWPVVAVERNNHGHAVLLELNDHIKYPNLFKHKDARIGWLTDRVTKPIMIDSLIDGIENQNLKVNSSRIFSECQTLVNKNGKMEAEDGKHDDTVMALAISLQVALQNKSSLYDNISQKIFV